MALRSKGSILVAVAAMLASAVDRAHAQEYADVLRKAILDSVVQSQERKYWIVSTFPTDNFGIATMQEGDKPTDFLCGTYRCLGLEGRESELSRYVESGTGTKVELSEAQHKALLASGMIPKVLRVLGISASAATQGVTVVSLAMGPATVRKMNPDRIEDRIREVNNRHVLQAVADGKLRYVFADIVAPFRITIDVDRSQAASVAIKLNAAAGSTSPQPATASPALRPSAPAKSPASPAASATPAAPAAKSTSTGEAAAVSTSVAPADPCATPQGTSASPPPAPSAAPASDAPLVSLRVDRETASRFALTSCRPLIVAVLPKRQPHRGVLGGTSKGVFRDGLPITTPIALKNVHE